MSTIASQITSLTIVYWTVYSGADQSKHQSSASVAFVWGIHRGPVNSPHKWPVTRKMFPFDDVIMLRDGARWLPLTKPCMSCLRPAFGKPQHYSDVIMSTIASLITSLTIVCSSVYSDADQRKHQSPASLAFVWGIHQGPVNSPHKWPVTRKMFPFDDVIMTHECMLGPSEYGCWSCCVTREIYLERHETEEQETEPNICNKNWPRDHDYHKSRLFIDWIV